MAVIKCNNCENEILDSEIVCPYCDHPVNSGADKPAKDENSSTASDSSSAGSPVRNIKIASISDFEKEKAALLKKLELDASDALAEHKSADTATNDAPAQETPVTDKTVKISKDNLNYERSKEAGSDSPRDVKTAASKIRINNPAATDSKRIKVNSGKTNSSKKGKTFIPVIVTLGIVIACVALILVITDGFGCSGGTPATEKTASSSASNQTSDTGNDSAKTDDKGFTISNSGKTLTITDASLITADYRSDSEHPWDSNKDKIMEIKIKAKADRIGEYAFYRLPELSHVILEGSIVEIADYAFFKCPKLTKVSCNDKSALEKIGVSAFAGCTQLSKLGDFPLQSIASKAFEDCVSLTRFDLPDDVEIEENTFDGCTELILICDKGSDLYEYAKEYGIETESENSDEEDETTEEEEDTEEEEEEEETTESQPGSGNDKSNNTSDNNSTTGTTPSTPSESNNNDSGSQNTSRKTEILKQINEMNSKINDPATGEAEKQKLIEERDNLSLELDKIITQ